MKALSIRQPWAWMILHAGKNVENRDWPTRYRGPIIIHAAKGMTRDEYEDCLALCHAISRRNPFSPGLVMPGFGDLNRGGIVGRAEIVDCVESCDSPWFSGRYGFLLKKSCPLRFIPVRGQLGFFDIPDDIVRAATAAESDAA